MKILMTADAVGGVWTYVTELASALSRKHVQVAVATMGPAPSSNQRQQISTIPNAVLFESGYKLEWMEDPWQELDKASAWLLEIEQSFKPNVVHLNGYAQAVLPWNAPSIVIAHSCVLSWWLAVNGEPAPDAAWKTYREKVTEGLRATRCVVAPTAAMLQTMRHLYLDFHCSYVIRNGIDSSTFLDLRKKNVIVSAGRLWDQAKNILLLDRAARQLRWPVIIAGSMKSPEGKLDEAPLATCHFVGDLDRQSLLNLFGEASIFCLPARYEPFGLSILEAACAGCALVLGDIPSLRELWDGAAAFVNPNDSEALAATLNSLIENPAQRSALAAAARERGRSLTIESTAAAYLRLYSKLTGDFAPARANETATCA